jgi:hypothetical protein
MEGFSDAVKFNCDGWLDSSLLSMNEGTPVTCLFDGADVGVN